MRPVLVVTGTRREGAVLDGAGIKVVAGGGDAAFLARELTREAPGAVGIVSFGMAGALHPDLRIGDWVIGSSVMGQGAAFTCDPQWIAALSVKLPAARKGPVYADGRLIAAASDKISLHQRMGAFAADMESHLAARAAAEAGLPFAVLRCISDEAGVSLPPAIAVAMAPGGGLALGRIVMSVIRYPSQLTDIIHSVSGFRRAYAALSIGTRAVGTRLAFDRSA